MVPIIFISGSRWIKELDNSVCQKLNKIISLNYRVIVGDCSGVDFLVQSYFKQANYANLTVYHAFEKPRHNLFGANTIRVPGKSHTAKDIEMSKGCDYGYAIWDGTSPGTFNNIKRLIQMNKWCLVYVSGHHHWIKNKRGINEVLKSINRSNQI